MEWRFDRVERKQKWECIGGGGNYNGGGGERKQKQSKTFVS